MTKPLLRKIRHPRSPTRSNRKGFALRRTLHRSWIAPKLRESHFSSGDEAKRYGAGTLYTDNDSTNTPILRVNEKLGFKPMPGVFHMQARAV